MATMAAPGNTSVAWGDRGELAAGEGALAAAGAAARAARRAAAAAALWADGLGARVERLPGLPGRLGQEAVGLVQLVLDLPRDPGGVPELLREVVHVLVLLLQGRVLVRELLPDGLAHEELLPGVEALPHERVRGGHDVLHAALHVLVPQIPGGLPRGGEAGPRLPDLPLEVAVLLHELLVQDLARLLLVPLGALGGGLLLRLLLLLVLLHLLALGDHLLVALHARPGREDHLLQHPVAPRDPAEAPRHVFVPAGLLPQVLHPGLEHLLREDRVLLHELLLERRPGLLLALRGHHRRQLPLLLHDSPRLVQLLQGSVVLLRALGPTPSSDHLCEQHLVPPRNASEAPGQVLALVFFGLLVVLDELAPLNQAILCEVGV
mmetsp:Transcript_43890/g.124251  ORF Transcript_43890/g.124251 Transcript_43890/m.124251 type:complete len:378 (+) Transcript_43890:299-1432(+)